MRILRFFTVRPEKIFEHPPGLSIVPEEIPSGTIEGYECYAPDFSRGDSSRVIGPFDPVVTHEEVPIGSVRKMTNLFIEIPGEGWESPRRFYFHDDTNPAYPRVPQWYQSGASLRFIVKKVPYRDIHNESSV